ncbi:SAM-dependent methyltransferase [soil metagenome]
MTALAEKLLRRVRARGPITFAEYMEAALYDSEYGYYATRARIGFEGDFLTASDLGPAFGQLLARAAADLWRTLGQPAEWDLVEAGAGMGTTMRDLLGALPREAAAAASGARPAIVEVSQPLREQQARALPGGALRWAASPRELAPINGVVFANELLDALPFHVLVRTPAGVAEAFVGEEQGRLAEVFGAPSLARLYSRIPEALPVGGRWEVSLAAELWIEELAKSLTRGYLLVLAYADDEAGLLARRGAGTVRGCARHRLLEDPLAAPGEHDITATVDLTAVARAAERAGLREVGRGTQRDVLIALGALDPTRSAPAPLERLRAASRRAATSALLDPNGFGAFTVVCFAKNAPAGTTRMFAGGPA